MLAHTSSGHPTTIQVEVPEGSGWVLSWREGPAALALHPLEVSELRRILLDAQATALLDRDSWW